MSYSDPQQVLDRRFSIINKGVSKLLGDTTAKVSAFNANQKKERDLYKKNMDSAVNTSTNRANAVYNKAKSASDKFTSGLYGSTGATTEEGVLFNDQISGVFENWGTELNNKISAVQAAGGSESEITALTNEYIGKLNQFTTDIANWEAAREEFMLAKQAEAEGGPNAVGTLLSDPELQRNPELINMFTAATDDELDNLYITVDPNGSTRISMGTITNGVFDAQSSTDISAWARSHQDSPDGKYFNTNEKFDTKDYEAMAGVFKDLEDYDNLKKGGKLDKELVREFLLEGDVGRSVMDSFLVDGTSKKKWASLYPSDETSRQYNDEDYLNIIIDNAWDDLYSPTQKKSSSKTSSSSKKSKNPPLVLNDPGNVEGSRAQKAKVELEEVEEEEVKKEERAVLKGNDGKELKVIAKEENKEEEKEEEEETTEEIKKLQKELEHHKTRKPKDYIGAFNHKTNYGEKYEKELEKGKKYQAKKIKELEEKIKKLKGK